MRKGAVIDRADKPSLSICEKEIEKSIQIKKAKQISFNFDNHCVDLCVKGRLGEIKEADQL